MPLRALLVVVLLFLGGANASAETYTTTEVGELDGYLGDPNAPVKVVIYSSLTCGPCKVVHEDLLPSLNTYISGGDVVYIYRHFPLDIAANYASMLATCQKSSDDFFMVIDTVFTYQKYLNKIEGYTEINRLLHDVTGIPHTSIQECYSSNVSQFIADRRNEAKELGVTSTPTIFVNGKKFSGVSSRNKIKRYVESLLN